MKKTPIIKEKIHSKPDIQIGKNGITENVTKDIITLLYYLWNSISYLALVITYAATTSSQEIIN